MVPSNDDWIGPEIANGRYKILGRIGQGSMGQVYLASDRNLEIDVVLKFPVAADKGSQGDEFLIDSPGRSARWSSQPSPHRQGLRRRCPGGPFLRGDGDLAGGSLKDRMLAEGRGECWPMPPGSLQE